MISNFNILVPDCTRIIPDEADVDVALVRQLGKDVANSGISVVSDQVQEITMKLSIILKADNPKIFLETLSSRLRSQVKLMAQKMHLG